MKHIKLIIPILAITLFMACNNGKRDATFAGGENTQTENQPTVSGGNIVLTVDGKKITVNNIDKEDSELTFYTPETILSVDAGAEIESKDGNQNINIAIEGLGKGKDEYKGNIDLEQSRSFAYFKDGETRYQFMEGTMEIIEFSKKSGAVKVKVSGKVMKKVGSSYKDVTLDLPATMEIDVVISDIRTFNYTERRNN
ncbi:MAG: hypothetical protein ACK5M1_08150 [Xanthomarina gelatinilytica]|uniref:hypothetical protein n=1 Tax=Xanthomarina gelatinilytica TaxID=1137281 RepID=UPI003A8AE7B2